LPNQSLEDGRGEGGIIGQVVGTRRPRGSWHFGTTVLASRGDFGGFIPPPRLRPLTVRLGLFRSNGAVQHRQGISRPDRDLPVIAWFEGLAFQKTAMAMVNADPDGTDGHPPGIVVRTSVDAPEVTGSTRARPLGIVARNSVGLAGIAAGACIDFSGIAARTGAHSSRIIARTRVRPARIAVAVPEISSDLDTKGNTDRTRAETNVGAHAERRMRQTRVQIGSDAERHTDRTRAEANVSADAERPRSEIHVHQTGRLDTEAGNGNGSDGHSQLDRKGLRDKRDPTASGRVPRAIGLPNGPNPT